jgi:hypothetical protein
MNKNRFTFYSAFLSLIVFILVSPGCRQNVKIKQAQADSICVQCSKDVSFECTAFISGIDKCEEENLLKFDSIAYFTGDAALKAYSEDKKNDKKIEPPAGFYIRNKFIDTLSFVISDNCNIVMQTLSHGSDGNYKFNEKINSGQFTKLFTKEGINFFKQKPFKLSIVNSEIVSIKEIYIP